MLAAKESQKRHREKKSFLQILVKRPPTLKFSIGFLKKSGDIPHHTPTPQVLIHFSLFPLWPKILVKWFPNLSLLDFRVYMPSQKLLIFFEPMTKCHSSNLYQVAPTPLSLQNIPMKPNFVNKILVHFV